MSVLHRYSHDNSETLEDKIDFIATDGTNSVSFILNVKVISFILQHISIETENHDFIHLFTV